MSLLPKNLLLHFSFVFPLFLLSISHADAFKCIDKKGNTIFQDSACSKNNTETKIPLKKKQFSRNEQCVSKCEFERDVCVADLGLGARNTNKNLSLCEKSRIACDTACIDSLAGRKLEELTSIERAAYERKIRNEQAEIEIDEYLKTRKIIKEKRNQQRNTKHCKRYEKKLAKLKAKWERKQQSGWTAKEETKYLEKIAEAKDIVIIECQ